jgi:hypothetical protein
VCFDDGTLSGCGHVCLSLEPFKHIGDGLVMWFACCTLAAFLLRILSKTPQRYFGIGKVGRSAGYHFHMQIPDGFKQA